MKKPIFLICALCLCLSCLAQSVISGKVIDAESKEVLPRASVFAQNTTRGTITDSSGNFRLYLEKGGYEVIVSYTGFTTKTFKVETSGDKQLTIELQKVDNNLSEVIIRSSNEVPDGWEKYGQFFIQHF